MLSKQQVEEIVYRFLGCLASPGQIVIFSKVSAWYFSLDYPFMLLDLSEDSGLRPMGQSMDKNFEE
jgi:hypothetical protein